VPERSRAAVLGKPIRHSLSPVLHRAAYAGLDLAWSYEAVECAAGELPDMLGRLAGDHAGVSLTMPLKLAAVNLVGELAPLARRVGAVNTVLFGGPRREDWTGYNTDVAGVRAALDELGLPVGSQVTLLGAGGSARAVMAALDGRAQRVTCLVRDPARAVGILEVAREFGVDLRLDRLDERGVGGWGDVVSTIPLGGNAELAARTGRWPGGRLLDLVYEGWPTPLARLATAAGAPVVGGLAVLVGQAAEAVRLMTGREPPVVAMRAAGEAALAGLG
jgi:shikimate dehydrogenase